MVQFCQDLIRFLWSRSLIPAVETISSQDGQHLAPHLLPLSGVCILLAIQNRSLWIPACMAPGSLVDLDVYIYSTGQLCHASSKANSTTLYYSRWIAEFKRWTEAGIRVFGYDCHSFGRSEPLDEAHRSLVVDHEHLVDDVYLFRKVDLPPLLASALCNFTGFPSLYPSSIAWKFMWHENDSIALSTSTLRWGSSQGRCKAILKIVSMPTWIQHASAKN